MVNFTVTFKLNGFDVGSTTGELDETHLEEEMLKIQHYFRTGGLAVQALNLGNWDSMVITVDGVTYPFSS